MDVGRGTAASPLREAEAAGGHQPSRKDALHAGCWTSALAGRRSSTTTCTHALRSSLQSFPAAPQNAAGCPHATPHFPSAARCRRRSEHFPAVSRAPRQLPAQHTALRPQPAPMQTCILTTFWTPLLARYASPHLTPSSGGLGSKSKPIFPSESVPCAAHLCASSVPTHRMCLY